MSDWRAIRKSAVIIALLLMSGGLVPSTAEAQEVIEYYGTDHLGSIRVVFDATGNVVSRADYLPFGEEMFAAGPMPAEHFTGQQRDGEAGLDYFNARQYQPRTGRFNAVDPVFVGPNDPQQWNRYAYARNNPIAVTDPTGMFTVDTNCRQSQGAYWCPGGGLFIPRADYVPSDNPSDSGYHGGEVNHGLDSYAANQLQMDWERTLQRLCRQVQPMKRRFRS